MKYAKYITGFVAFLPLQLSADAPVLFISSSAGEVSLHYETDEGRWYEIWDSTDLTPNGWSGPLDARVGTGADEIIISSTSGHSRRFFQLRVSDLAPSATEFATLVVGKRISDGYTYLFTSTTEFIWFDQTGKWSYIKTGVDTATIVFTYDGDNSNVYREELTLTFSDKFLGTFDYCAYSSNVCDTENSDSMVPFALSDLDLTDTVPSATEFATLVVEKMLTDTDYTYRFTSATRFVWSDNTGTYRGDWLYTKTGANTATIVFTYDGDNPEDYREVIALTFDTGNSGTFDYCEYIDDVCNDENSDYAVPFVLALE